MTIQLSDHFTYKKLFRFTLPSVAMMVFSSVYGVVDGFFVSADMGHRRNMVFHRGGRAYGLRAVLFLCSDTEKQISLYVAELSSGGVFLIGKRRFSRDVGYKIRLCGK